MSYAVVLEGALQDYAWGRVDGLQRWTGRATGGPEAELWFGTHVSAPSPVVAALPAGTDREREAALLVKLLAAARPLSIQLHPSTEAIRAIRDGGAGDLLADDGEKFETLVALERFEILAGLRDADTGATVLRALGLPDAAARCATGDVPAAIAAALASGGSCDYDAALAALDDSERAVMRKVVDEFAGDRGLPVAFLLQPHVLEPGDAVAVRVGTVHAYVSGLGVEVMTSSDNVLRLGLTPKRVSVEASLRALDPTARPAIERGPDEVSCYGCTGMPFSVTRVDGGEVELGEGAIALCVEGHARAESSYGMLEAVAGQALFAEAGSDWVLRAEGTTFVATPR